MEGQRQQQNTDVHTYLGDVLDGQVGLGANTNMGNTGDSSAAAPDQDSNGGETHSVQRTAARRSSNRRTREEIIQLEAAFRENPHPEENQRTDVAKRIGMTQLQVKFWFQNRRSGQKIIDQRRELKELQEAKEAVQAERLALKLNNTCLTCGGQVRDETQQHLLSEIERLKDELQRANVLLNKRNALLDALATNHSGSATSKVLVTNRAPTNQMMPVNEGSASSQQRDTNTMLIDLAARALNEFCKLVNAGSPMWLPTPDGKADVLNLQQYIDTMSPSIFGPYRMGFVVDGTRKTGDVMCTAHNLLCILMDVAHWSDIFSGIVASATGSHIFTPGASQHGMVLLMDAELRVLSPRVPVRKIKFVRHCQEVQPGKWAVVDVSVDGILGVPPTYIASRLRPSGCLIEEKNNSNCKVTWMVNMEYNETNVFPLYRQLLRSGQAFGASNWLASLQRQCEYLVFLHTIPGNPADIVLIARKNIFEAARRMRRSFYEAMFGPWSKPWRSVDQWCGDCGIGVERFKVVARILTFSAGAPREQAGDAVVSATAPIWLPGIPAKDVFDYLCDGNRRGEWDTLANGAPILQEAYFATGQLPGNAVSIHRTIASDGTNGKLILQEVCADTSCMLLAYSTVDEQSMQHAMTSGDHTSLYLLPSGLVILPDGASPISDTCSSSTAVSHKSNTGSFVSAIYQTELNVQPPEKVSVEATHNYVGNLLCRVIEKIKDAVHANNVVAA